MGKTRVTLDRGGMRALRLSGQVASALAPHAARVAAAARSDPNEFYRATIRVTDHRSTGAGARVSKRVGAQERIGVRVEARRQTLARALGGG